VRSILVTRRKISPLTQIKLRIGQPIYAAAKNKPLFEHPYKTYIVDAVHDHGGDDEKRIVVVHEERNPSEPFAEPSEWFICNCRSEFGTPVLYGFKKISCEKNILHFVKKFQEQNFDKEYDQTASHSKLEIARVTKTAVSV
jgi:hypothetical protein